MGVASVVKRIAGIDDSAALRAEIERVKAEGAEALDEAEKCEADALTAETDEDADRLTRQASSARLRSERRARQLDGLQERVKRAQDREQDERETQLVSRHRAAYVRYKSALEQLASVQGEAIRIDQDAVRTLGEGRARSLMPPIVYGGLVRPECIQMWIDYHDKLFSVPLSKRPPSAIAGKPGQTGVPYPTVDHAHQPAVFERGPRRLAPKPTIDTPHIVRLDQLATGPQSAPRPPDDSSPLNAGEVRVRVLRGGYSPGDDRPQCHAGQLVRMKTEAAARAANAGAVEIIEEAPNA